MNTNFNLYVSECSCYLTPPPPPKCVVIIFNLKHWEIHIYSYSVYIQSLNSNLIVHSNPPPNKLWKNTRKLVHSPVM